MALLPPLLVVDLIMPMLSLLTSFSFFRALIISAVASVVEVWLRVIFIFCGIKLIILQKRKTASTSKAIFRLLMVAVDYLAGGTMR